MPKPLLLPLVISDLDKLTNKCIIFANDINVAGKDTSQELGTAERWWVLWYPTLSSGKCQLLSLKETISEIDPHVAYRNPRS